MAEIAGLVIGGVSLTALVDPCINILKHVDSGRQCSVEYQDAALMLTLIGGRLDRWERTIREGAILQITEEDGENADLWLRQVRRRLEEAEKLAQRYSVETVRPTVELSSMVERLQGKLMRQHDGLSLSKKARWALLDQDKMQGLIEKLNMQVGSLEALFPTLHNARAQMLQRDVVGVTEGSSPEVMQSLQSAAAQVDKDFALTASSHMYRNIDNTDEARVNMGDFVSTDGSALRGGSHTYDGVHSSGRAIVSMGNQYGGSSIFELQSTQ